MSTNRGGAPLLLAPTARKHDTAAVSPDTDSEHGEALLPASDDGRRVDRAALLSAVESKLFGGAAEPVRVGRYTLDKKIGHGGFGIVYRAHDPTLGRDVAVKLLRSRRKNVHGLGGPEALIREARIAAQLQNPNVVRIFDVGRIEGGLGQYTQADVFIVMELLSGEPLHRWLEAGHRTAEEIVAVFLRAADGLAAAHQQQIVHCDFKPANVFVCEDGSIKVLDFGLAMHTATRAPTTLKAPVTQRTSRLVAGTPMYMAPEAHAGKDLEASADQYSFALTLLQSLAGEYPFAHVDRRALAQAKAAGVPATWMKAREIPRGLVPILERASHPDPQHRYPGTDALASELRAWHTQSKAKRTGMWVLLGVGVVGLAAAVALQPEDTCRLDVDAASKTWEQARAPVAAQWKQSSLTYATEGKVKFEGEIDAFVQDWTQVVRSACEADATGDAPPTADNTWACLRERVGRLDAVLGTVAEAENVVLLRANRLAKQLLPPSDCLDPESRAAPPPIPPDPADQLRVEEIRDLLSAARTRYAVGRYAQGLPLARRGLEQALDVGFEPAQAEARYELGVLAVAAGQLDEGADQLEQSYLRAEAQRHDRLAAAASVRLVSVHGLLLMKEAQARDWARRAAFAIERLHDNGLYRASLEYNLGLLEHTHGSLSLAKQHFENALQLYVEANDPQDATVCRLALGIIVKEQGDPELALKLFRAAYTQQHAELGLQHPDTATALASLAAAQSSVGQLLVALQNFKNAIEVFRAVLGPTHHAVASGLINLGTVEFELAEYDDALVHHQGALDIYRASLPEDHPMVAIAVDNIAALQLRLGNYEAARKGHAEALALRKSQLDASHPLLPATHANLGTAYAYLGRHEEAAKEFAVALSLIPKLKDGKREVLGSVLFAHGRSLRLAGEPATAPLRRAVELLSDGPPSSILADARFELAQEILPDNRDEAIALARAARARLLSMGASRRVGPIDAWLAQHSPTP